ncbi:hypothetical protein COLO4_00299 [Corchorus olitorius]|uniref:CASP-like protein n=1 Tax=Corchorus olitorius TaxID=93759 RepID=A0A1R3L429_9ROSI|nr:hypothetical protein COLO4_00299 [Corchorus olitorius]
METTINISENKDTRKGKAPLLVSSPKAAVEPQPKQGFKKGLAIFDFLLRLCATGAALGAATTVGTAQQTLPFFTQFFQFQTQYNDLPTLVYINIIIYINFIPVPK